MKGDHAEHIHANCDCTFAVRFDEKSSYDSYNPDKYAEIYYSAEGSSSTDKINSIRRELYKTNGDTIREQKRIAYAARKERVVESIGRSVGAKARNFAVYNPQTGDFVALAEGTHITQPKNHVIAGKGRERQIDCLDWLVDKHGGNPVEWTKEKGFGYINDEHGELHRVELHWYQEPTVGKVEMKIKDKDGEIYIDD